MPGYGAADIMKVTVKQGVQVVHDGTVFADGETADVPDHVVELWLRSGWVEKVVDQLEAGAGRRAAEHARSRTAGHLRGLAVGLSARWSDSAVRSPHLPLAYVANQVLVTPNKVLVQVEEVVCVERGPI